MDRRTLLVACTAAVAPFHAFAQDAFPARAVRIVVGFPPGGGADVVARQVAQHMGATLGQPVVVDNKAGAGGNIAAEYVVNSPADGYTLYLATASNAVNAAAAANGTLKLNYDLRKDLAPVVQLVRNQIALVAHPSLPAASVKDVISLAKGKPGTLNFGVMSATSQLAGELFRQMANVAITDVPYKGAAPVVTDLIGGQVQLAILDAAVVLPHIQSGKLKALAVTAATRFDGLPQVPTMAESGVPGYEAIGWLGLMAPAATPPQAIARLRDAAAKALSQAEVTAELKRLGVTPAAGSSQQFGSFVRDETAKWQKVMKAGNITLGS